VVIVHAGSIPWCCLKARKVCVIVVCVCVWVMSSEAFKVECYDHIINTGTSYLWGPHFSYWLSNWSLWLRFRMVFLIPCRQMPHTASCYSTITSLFISHFVIQWFKFWQGSSSHQRSKHTLRLALAITSFPFFLQNAPRYEKNLKHEGRSTDLQILHHYM
jgi:hypothetical protein